MGFNGEPLRDWADGNSVQEILANRQGFWQALNESERTALRGAGRTREYAAGALLCSQGADPDHVLIILDGWCKVTAGRADGHEVMLAIRGPADTIGESGWLNGRPRSANVKALNRVRALAVPAEQFANFLNAHAHAAQVLARVMVGRMDDADRRMTSQVGTSGPKLLALLLLDLAERYGVPGPDNDGVALPLPLTQHELATMIGRARETVARALTVWRKDGVVTTQRMRILILDPDALREVAEAEDDD
jgi:CRP/FNR family transcriptional regulator, cyclic AMP receptor protein